MPYFSDDDIVQICTPPGVSPLGALRLSGGGALKVFSAACVEPALSERPRRGVHSCRLRLRLDDRFAGVVRELPCPAKALIMPAPNSYTREDVVEIHLPGSPALLGAGLDALVRAGARLAAPGEFTFRAFRNGRISLAQAEAVEAVVTAADDAERRQALARLGDGDGGRIARWRDACLDIAARIEAVLDFSEEELEGDIAVDMLEMIERLEREGVELSASGPAAATDVPQVALLGLANAGKSSLYNALLGAEAALVSPEASTTRDRLCREVEWHGVRLGVSDNPGYHPEGEGGGRDAAERAFRRMGGEDVACWVIDGSGTLDERHREFARRLVGPVLVVLNKADLGETVADGEVADLAAEIGVELSGVARTSAAAGAGVAELRRRLADLAGNLAGVGRWNGRERLELSAALSGCRAAARELAGPARLELAAEEMRQAAAAFSRALGEGYAEDVLVRIFSSFCIGK